MHFALAGVFLFWVFSVLNPDDGPRDLRIELTDGDLRQMTAAWLAQGRAAPTPEQLASLVDHKVKEEVFYREALALGLDEDDTIVRRRLAQKMEFLAEEAAVVPEPTEAELLAWYREHPERIALPGRVTFSHLYFSPDRRGSNARGDAAAALVARTDAAAEEWEPTSPADPFMFQDHYGDRSPEDVASIFGRSFGDELFELPLGVWAGPIESGYGWHLVRVEAMMPARVPEFEVVRSEVRAEWFAEQRDVAQAMAFEELRDRYEIVVPVLGNENLEEVASR